MSARRKTPTADENKKTAIFDSGNHLRKKAPSDFPQEVDPTVVDGPLGRPAMAEQPAPSPAAPTVHAKPLPPSVQAAVRKDQAQTVPAKPLPPAVHAVSKKEQSAPIQVISKKEQSAPIQAISMKTPDGQARPPAPENPPTPILQRPKLRAVSEVKPAEAPQNYGSVAQPYDPKEARARAVREYVIWGCLAVILASAIALVVWFVAR